MYPTDAITLSFTTRTAGSYTIIPATTTPITILHGSISDVGTDVDCATTQNQSFILGTSSITVRNCTNYDNWLHLVYSSTSLRVQKTGNASTTFGVTYVLRDRTKTPDPYPYATGTLGKVETTGTTTTTVNIEPATTTPPIIQSYQEVLFLVAIVVIPLYFAMFSTIFRRKKSLTI